MTFQSPGDTPRTVSSSKVATDTSGNLGAPGAALVQYGRGRFPADFRQDPYDALRKLNALIGLDKPEEGTEELEEFKACAHYVFKMVFERLTDRSAIARWIKECESTTKRNSAFCREIKGFQESLGSFDQEPPRQKQLF